MLLSCDHSCRGYLGQVKGHQGARGLSASWLRGHQGQEDCLNPGSEVTRDKRTACIPGQRSPGAKGLPASQVTRGQEDFLHPGSEVTRGRRTACTPWVRGHQGQEDCLHTLGQRSPGARGLPAHPGSEVTRGQEDCLHTLGQRSPGGKRTVCILGHQGQEDCLHPGSKVARGQEDCLHPGSKVTRGQKDCLHTGLKFWKVVQWSNPVRPSEAIWHPRTCPTLGSGIGLLPHPGTT